MNKTYVFIDLMPVNIVSEVIEIGSEIETDLEPVYRATKNEVNLCMKDFNCQIENEIGNKKNVGNYACSVNLGELGKENLAALLDSLEGLRVHNPYVAVGKLKTDTGLIQRDSKDHINWWIFRDSRNVIHSDFNHYMSVKEFIEEREEDHDFK